MGEISLLNSGNLLNFWLPGTHLWIINPHFHFHVEFKTVFLHFGASFQQIQFYCIKDPPYSLVIATSLISCVKKKKSCSYSAIKSHSEFMEFYTIPLITECKMRFELTNWTDLKQFQKVFWYLNNRGKNKKSESRLRKWRIALNTLMWEQRKNQEKKGGWGDSV